MGKTRQQHRSRSHEREDGDGTRTVRLQELIREEVNLILRNEVRDPRLDSVVITMVELAGDGSCARLWFTAEEDDAWGAGELSSPRTIAGGAGNPVRVPKKDARREACEHVAGFLRTQLAESLGLKRTPELRFRRDPATRALAPAETEI
jgi:ribosome-binding factor A